MKHIIPTLIQRMRWIAKTNYLSIEQNFGLAKSNPAQCTRDLKETIEEGWRAIDECYQLMNDFKHKVAEFIKESSGGKHTIEFGGLKTLPEPIQHGYNVIVNSFDELLRLYRELRDGTISDDRHRDYRFLSNTDVIARFIASHANAIAMQAEEFEKYFVIDTEKIEKVMRRLRKTTDREKDLF